MKIARLIIEDIADCPYLFKKRYNLSGETKEYYCDITGKTCDWRNYNDREGHIPDNCPLEDAK